MDDEISSDDPQPPLSRWWPLKVLVIIVLGIIAWHYRDVLHTLPIFDPPVSTLNVR